MPSIALAHQTISFEELQKLGKSLYRQGDYNGALNAFTKAIDSCDAPSIGLLDNRAATYEKLEDLRAALRDGKRMIKVSREDVKGYLRSGKILQKLQQPDVALGVYQYGLKNVPEQCSEYMHLQALCVKLRAALVPPKPIDPWVALPTELAEIVVGHLPFVQFLVCLRVSKRWHKFLTSYAPFWKVLDTSQARKPVSSKYVRNFVQRSQGLLESATLYRVSQDALPMIASRCKKLATLSICTKTSPYTSLSDSIVSMANLQTLVLGSGTHVTIEAVNLVLNRCLKLVHVSFLSVTSPTSKTLAWGTPLPNLRRLELAQWLEGRSNWMADQSFFSINLSDFARRACNLESLTFHHWGASTSGESVDFREFLKLEHLTLDECWMMHVPPLPWCVRSFSISQSRKLQRAPSNEQALLENDLPLLTELHLLVLDSAYWIDLLLFRSSNLHYESDRSSFAKLKKLSLGSTYDVMSDYLIVLANPRFELVEDLRASNQECDVFFVEHLRRCVPHLRSLSLSSADIDGVEVKALVTHLTKLEFLRFDRCRRLSPDAIDWARSKGIRVDCTFPADSGKARKVRYG